jgi:anti-sigma regulatory factor (Ser/Thr protein kinase)
MTNKETFKISAALKDIIGKELITDEFVAVFELVKNSFDADASNVEIIFENNHEPDNARIILKDNGNGMNYDDLKNKWLFVAYSDKRLGQENKDYRNKIKPKRIFAGAKGVGRFSCDRLGKFLNLITLKNESNAIVQNLIVNWENFENADNKEFIKINVIHNVITNNEYQLKNGTVLEISGLRDIWDREHILKLKRSLEKLINPNQENDSQNFTIKIIANDEKFIDRESNKKGEPKNESEKVNGFVKNSIFETLQIKTTNISVKISPDSQYIETILLDRGDKIYYLKEKNPYPNLRNISVYLFQLNRSAKSQFTRLMGMESVKYGSVFMYKNGFRIYPYGEDGEDLLQIDRRKQQGYNRFLGTRDLIGRIEINGEQRELRETTSRDGGLIKTQTYKDLVNFFYDYVLRRLENYVVNIIQWGDDKIDKETGEIISAALWAKDVKIQILGLITGFINTKDIVDIQYDDDFLNVITDKQDKSVNKIMKDINCIAEKSRDVKLINKARNIEKVILLTKADATKAYRKAIEAENIAQKREEQVKRCRAAESIEYKDLRDSNHIIGQYSDEISKRILSLKRKIDKNISISNKELLEFLNGISFANEKIATLTRFTTKSNFLEAIYETTEDIVHYIKAYIDDIYKVLYEGIDIQFLSNGISYIKTFEPIELCTALDNIFGNSRKKRATKIIVEFFKNGDKLKLSIRDIGKPLNSSIADYNLIFEEGITTTNGAGLGLSHVKRIVEDNLKGKIKYNPDYKQGFELIITF